MIRLIILDTETSGLKDPRPCEIAWVECDTALNIVDQVTSLIDPECAISPGASGVHGITNDMVAHMPTMHEFFSVVHDDPLGYGDILFCAHNAAYDLPLVKPHIGNLVGTLCTLKLARRIYPDAENHKLQTLRYTFGLDAGDAHRAMGDAVTTHALLKQMVRDTGLSVLDLHAWVNQPQFVDTINFGKHKGCKLKDLPKNYVTWLLGLDNLDDDLRFSLQQL